MDLASPDRLRFDAPMHSYTALAAGPVALLIAGLGGTISLIRLARKASGPGFERLHRAHGNAVEHAPLLLILLFIAEALGARPITLLAAAVGIVLARFLHAAGMLLRRGGPQPLQRVGAGLTYLLEAGLGVIVLVRAL
jgi:uncharacterized membrane protein YecN with MAPEG domain